MKGSPTISTQTLIVGGGLAGLSAAYHLKGTPFLLLEKENQCGGLARSFHLNGFTFDFTGHLLHLHHRYSRNLILGLLRKNHILCKRNSWIFSENTYTPYPYQANTSGLSEKTKDECVLGFLDAHFNQEKKSGIPGLDNFRDWCISTFGKGIAEHFMIPYNQKLFQNDARSMTADWCGPFVPQPTLEEVLRGAVKPQEKKFGYNPHFYYPLRGGIQSLVNAFANQIGHIRTDTSVTWINWKEKLAGLSTGATVKYTNLINTMPLKELLKKLKPREPWMEKQGQKLRCESILCLNIGVKRPRISDKSWIYFPEDKFLFYRVGFPMNFTPHGVPPGHSSMYIEIPFKAVRHLTKDMILKKTLSGLLSAGILQEGDIIPVVQFLPIRHAYVIYNQDRLDALKIITTFLTNHHIQSIGRYGAWKYSFMEEAILDGKEAASNIKKPRKRPSL